MGGGEGAGGGPEAAPAAGRILILDTSVAFRLLDEPHTVPEAVRRHLEGGARVRITSRTYTEIRKRQSREADGWAAAMRGSVLRCGRAECAEHAQWLRSLFDNMDGADEDFWIEQKEMSLRKSGMAQGAAAIIADDSLRDAALGRLRGGVVSDIPIMACAMREAESADVALLSVDNDFFVFRNAIEGRAPRLRVMWPRELDEELRGGDDGAPDGPA